MLSEWRACVGIIFWPRLCLRDKKWSEFGPVACSVWQSRSLSNEGGGQLEFNCRILLLFHGKKKRVNSQENKSHYHSQTTVVPPRVSRSDPGHSRGWCLVPTGFPSKNWSKNQSKDGFQSSTLMWHIWRNCLERLVKLYCRFLTISGYTKVFTLGGKQRLPCRCGFFFRCVFLGCDFVAWKFEVVRLKVKYSGLGGVWVHLVAELTGWCATLLPSVRRVCCLLQIL